MIVKRNVGNFINNTNGEVSSSFGVLAEESNQLIRISAFTKVKISEQVGEPNPDEVITRRRFECKACTVTKIREACVKEERIIAGFRKTRNAGGYSSFGLSLLNCRVAAGRHEIEYGGHSI